MEIQPFETLEAHDAPTVRQHSVFIENQIGQLLKLTKLFDRTDTRIVAVSVVNSIDCAICRMILDDPDRGYEILSGGNFPTSEAELVVVALPHGQRGLLHCWAALLSGEINIHYTYPLLVRPKGAAAIAVMPDNIDQAVGVLRHRGFDVLDQSDLLEDRHL